MWENVLFLIRCCFTESRVLFRASWDVLSEEKESKWIVELKIQMGSDIELILCYVCCT